MKQKRVARNKKIIKSNGNAGCINCSHSNTKMPTIKAALDELSKHLSINDSKYLLSQLIDKSSEVITANLKDPLTPKQFTKLQALINELKTQKPLAQILGKTTVINQEFIVDQNVLIPRPETEILIEEAIKTLQNIIPATAGIQVLELGTGTGCIAITLAGQFPNIQVHAWDISKSAITCAQKNKNNLNTPNLTLIHNDFFKDPQVNSLLSNGKQTLLITNPPYIPTKDIASLDPSVKNFEPHDALDGGETGLDFYQKLHAYIKRYRPYFLAEFGIHQSPALKKIFHAQTPIIINDYANIPRILKIFPPSSPRFNKKADAYSKNAIHQSELGRKLRTTLSARFPNFNPQKILDIGCAEGQGTQALQAQYPAAKITAIDNAEEMIKLATQLPSPHHPELVPITFQSANAETDPFPEPLDLIHSNATLQWIQNLPALLKKIHAALTPTGILAATLYGPKTYQELSSLICNPLPAATFHTAPELKKMIEEVFPNITISQAQTRITYPSLITLLKAIQNTGTTTQSSQKGLYTPRTLKKLESRYQDKFGSIIATHQTYTLISQK